MKTSLLARQSTLMLLAAVSLPSLAVVRAQTLPDLPPTSADPKEETVTAPATLSGADEILLDAGFEIDTTGITTSQTADKVAVARGEGQWKSGSGALNWNYVLDGKAAPRLTVEAANANHANAKSVALDRAKSVRFWLKTGAPAAIAIYFEEAQPANDKNEPTRYVATVWSAGGDWTQYDLSRDRFAPEITPADNADDAPLPLIDWTRIVRFGVRDATNDWLKDAGQVHQSGARHLWLDSFQVVTAPAGNAPLVEVDASPSPQPATLPATNPDAAQPAPAEEKLVTPLEDNAVMVRGEGGADGDLEGDAPENEGDAGNDGADAGGADEGANAPVEEPPLRVRQDDRGDARLWIPINGTSIASEKGGLSWSYIRLANRVTALEMAVNPFWMKQFPLTFVRPGEKMRDKNLRLEVVLRIQKATRLNIAITERGGATYSKTVAVTPRPAPQRLSIALPDMSIERTRPDKNNRLDLNRIQSIAIGDVGAQYGIAGPNQITLLGATWTY